MICASVMCRRYRINVGPMVPSELKKGREEKGEMRALPQPCMGHCSQSFHHGVRDG